MAEQTLSSREIASMIDISAVQTPHGEAEIRELVNVASQFGIGAVHVLPAWVTFARTLLADTPHIALGAPVGFPSGGNHTRIKYEEAQQVIADGVSEFDMMLNVGKLRSGDDDYVRTELQTVIQSVRVPAKVILETHYLNDDEIRRACQMGIETGAAYIKTSTGWADTGATFENVRLIRDCVQDRIGIKAAGGIRDLATLEAMYAMGVRRFGINVQAAIAIIQAARQRDVEHGS